jgi:hypothetical protein
MVCSAAFTYSQCRACRGLDQPIHVLEQLLDPGRTPSGGKVLQHQLALAAGERDQSEPHRAVGILGRAAGERRVARRRLVRRHGVRDELVVELVLLPDRANGVDDAPAGEGEHLGAQRLIRRRQPVEPQRRISGAASALHEQREQHETREDRDESLPSCGIRAFR